MEKLIKMSKGLTKASLLALLSNLVFKTAKDDKTGLGTAMTTIAAILTYYGLEDSIEDFFEEIQDRYNKAYKTKHLTKVDSEE